ncbi:MAG TPA: PUA domain-containing protein, partial [Desulfurivibrionaceae bacterium]|nr:PUA domain-containing protein [Desulfurivibrionaceae bacterium]
AGPTPSGVLRVDRGAAEALRAKGRSLLPAGIAAVEGDFERGDAVSIVTPKGVELARGITRYSATEMRQIRGGHSDEIAHRLGYAYGPVAVHRNDLILV